MDDLNSTLNAILGDPDKMAQLRAVAESLGLNPGGAPPAQPAQNAAPADSTNTTNPGSNGNGGGGGANATGGGGIDPASIASLLHTFQNFQNANQNPSGGNSENASPGDSSGDPSGNLGTISKLTQVFSTFNQNDKNVELMRSLKPHFSSARAGRVDDAIRIMQVLRAWPVLRDSGLLGNLSNLFGGGRR